MRRPLFLSLLLLASSAHSQVPNAAECLLDVNHFAAQARELAKKKNGVVVPEGGFAVRWHDKRLGPVSVAIGGCHHLRLLAEVEVPSGELLSQAQAVRLARRLISSSWPKVDAAAVAGTLADLPSESLTPTDRTHVRYGIRGYEFVRLRQRVVNGTLTLSVEAVLDT